MACFLVIYQPDGQVYNPNGQEDCRYRLSEMISLSGKPEITIGRDKSMDICLPADDKEISQHHCSLEIKDNKFHFWIKSDSTNETYLRKSNLSDPVGIYVVNDEKTGYPLKDKDEILIKSKFTAPGNPHWRCVFQNENETERAKIIDLFQIKYYYHLESRKLCIENSLEPMQLIVFSGQESDLVHYLAEKTRWDQVCPYIKYQELNKHLVGNPSESNAKKLSPLVSRINRSIREKMKSEDTPKLIENVNQRGYRLNNCHVTDKLREK
jgi:pSer/pThr/pTyr-binding forkhead associated (FHA) protein